jgi:hypothetical protein
VPQQEQPHGVDQPGFVRMWNMKYAFMPQPANTPIGPGNRPGSCPESSIASHAHSRK